MNRLEHSNTDGTAGLDIRNIRTTENDDSSAIEKVAVFLSFLLFIITFPIAVFLCIVIIPVYKRGVIFRLGRLRKGGPHGPGVIFVFPCIDNCIQVELRTLFFDVPPQEVLTKDSVTIKLDAVVYFMIDDPLKAVIQVENVIESTKLLAQTTLRNIAGTKMLMELLSDKDDISHSIETILDEATDPWGVKVERVEIKDVRLPQSLQRAMAAEAEATREAKAKIVAAQGELNASKALKEASDIISTNPVALQLRYLQTLNTISAEKTSTIIFPFPIEIMGVDKNDLD